MSWLRNFPPFMERECSLPSPQNLTTRSYPATEEFNQQDTSFLLGPF
jgi:hypothetical protein